VNGNEEDLLGLVG